MNEDLGTIQWKVGVDTTDLDRAEDRQDRYTEHGERTAKKIKKQGDDMAKSYTGVATAIKTVGTALVALGATRALRDTIRTTNEFTASISELSAITGAAGDDLAYLSAQSKDIGRTTTLSASQAATAFKLIASAKPDLLESGEALNMVTREAVTLAEAAKIDLPTAADSLGNALNQFGAGADQASRFINVLAAGSKLGSSSISDTAQAMKNAGAAANALGVDFETANAAVQALSAGGLKAAEAGTGLRNILVILEQEADANLRPSVVGLTQAMKNLEAQNLSNTEKIDLFGRMNLIAGQTMLDQLPILERLEGELRGTSVAYEQARVNNDNLTGDLKASASAAEGLQIALGEKMTPAIRDATQEFTSLLVAATEFVESEQFTETMETAKTAAELLAVVIGSRLVTGLGLAAVKFLSAATAAGVLSKAVTMMGGPLGIAATAVYGLVKALEALEEKQRDAIAGAIESAAREGLESLDLFIVGQAMKLNQLYADLEQAEQLRGHKRRQEIARINREIEDQTRIMEQASERRKKLVDEQVESQEQLGETFGVVGGRIETDFVGPMQQATTATEELKTETSSLADELERKLRLLGMSERDQFLYNEQLKLGADATMEERLEVEKLAGALYDEKAAQNAAAQASRDAANADKERQKVSREMREAIQRDWEKTRDTISSALIQAGEEGFGSVLDTSKRVLKKIVADWAAAQIMNVTGLSALIGAGGLGSGGGLPGGGGIGGMASTAGGLGNLAGLAGGGGLAGLVSGAGQFIGGLTGTGVGAGSAIVGPPTAATAAGSNLAAIATPAAIAIAVAAAAKFIHDKTSDPDGFKREMTGFLGAPTPGAPAGSTFSVDAFASGFRPQGIADGGGASRQLATEVIDRFRGIDSTITQLAREAGGVIDLSRATLGGFGLDGTGAGTFFGISQRTTEAQAREQIDSFSRQLGRHIHGLDEDATARIESAKTTEELIAVLNELVAEQKQANANAGSPDVIDVPVTPSGAGVIPSAASTLSAVVENNTTHGTVPTTLAEAMAAGGQEEGTHYADGVLVSGQKSFAEKERQDRVDSNLFRLQYGYDPTTGEFASAAAQSQYYRALSAQNQGQIPPPPLPMSQSQVNAAPVTDGDLLLGDSFQSGTSGKLLVKLTNEISKLTKINKTWNRTGLPETRATTPG